jgi:hypothetical protein
MRIRPRWLIPVGVLLLVGAAAGINIALIIPPPASTANLPASVTVDGVVLERVRLFTLRTTPGRETVEAQLPVTSRPILVRASCRLALLHTSRAASAFMVEMWWTREGGNAATSRTPRERSISSVTRALVRNWYRPSIRLGCPVRTARCT